MRLLEEKLHFSPSDLSNHLVCEHLTQLNLGVIKGVFEKPDYFNPDADILQQRGLEFENAYLEFLKKAGFSISIPGNEDSEIGIDRTILDMKRGTDIIYQAHLTNDNWFGIADFLKKTDKPSDLGTWSYEVIDTKLARNTKAGSVLQLCFYSQAIEKIQGVLPDQMLIVTPHDGKFHPLSFRTFDFMAYYRLMQNTFKKAISERLDTYPEPVAHCNICRWWQVCNQQRRTDDHLSFVAGISKLQRNELETWSVEKLEQLAQFPIPFTQRPKRGAIETYVRVREQARIQYESRIQNIAKVELLEVDNGFGLNSLPVPTAGDIFLDFEGDPFVGISGQEYLTGWIEVKTGAPQYFSVWAHNAAEEKSAFETFMDRVSELLQKYPDLHIYHFGHYEPSALKRLMSRYVTRERELDRLLRGKRFINLHTIVKQSLRASVEKYSLKDMEVFHGFHRNTDLRLASHHRHIVERYLELSLPTEIPEEAKSITQAYNYDDCISTLALREWMENIRSSEIQKGKELVRPLILSGEESEQQEERNQITRQLFEQLISGIDPDSETWSAEDRGKWLMANMLEWHWRENKAQWWEFFRLKECPDDELIEEKAALCGLRFDNRFEHEDKYVVDLYFFPNQNSDIREGDSVIDQNNEFAGTIINVNADEGWVTIKKAIKYQDIHPSSVLLNEIPINKSVLIGSLCRIGRWVIDNGVDTIGSYRAARDLLLKKPPNPTRDAVHQHDNFIDSAVEWSSVLNQSCLPIQGPPGSGKTFTGAEIIVQLVKQGKKVGVTALSHKVIETLLNGVVEAGAKEDANILVGQKVSKKSDVTNLGIKPYTDNAGPLIDLQKGKVHVVGATGYMWSREDYFDSIDVLVVDEAGQLSLADTLAASQCAKNLILLGDPQQLKQPQQGSHPPGTDVSALEHILDGHPTIAHEKGLFIDHTRRMHPNICAFISEMFYENKLFSFPGLDQQLIEGDTPFEGAGLFIVPVDHSGNQNSSPEEADIIRDIVTDFTKGDVWWINQKGEKRVVVINDILIISPYNFQVMTIKSRIPDARVGTVDKFQGQEAPIVIYSMATSSPEDAPRGMEFLYSPNRFNVAISRARSVAIVVANPKLFSPECKTPDQMRMANVFCRFLEMAKIAD